MSHKFSLESPHSNISLLWVALTEIEAHKEVGGGEVADQEPGHVHLVAGEGEDEHHAAVTEQRQQEDNPDPAAQRPPVKQVVTGKEGAGGGVTVYSWREKRTSVEKHEEEHIVHQSQQWLGWTVLVLPSGGLKKLMESGS